jgi:hypothetical protein
MNYWLKNKLVDTVIFLNKKRINSKLERRIKRTHIHETKNTDTNPLNNYYVFNSPARLILAHFESFIKEHYRLKDYFLLTRNVAIIIDESAKIKNQIQTLQKCFLICLICYKKNNHDRNSVANRPEDIWAQIYFLDQGESLGKDFMNLNMNVI